MRFPAVARLALISAATVSAAFGQIYADIETSMGSFTCELNYEKAPKAVANFIGLAEGSRTWIDPATGALQAGVPFYEGVIFHRVIAGFMNQAGSKNGLGTDGPGYVFLDETANGLKHEGPGILSMANSGKNTNGSQIFVTVTTRENLDGKHTVFGKVTGGMSVVSAINGVPTGANDKPVTPVVIESVRIRREDAAAEAFDIHAQGLPVCGPAPGVMSVSGPGEDIKYLLKSPQPPGSIFAVHRSSNLQTWSFLGSIYQQLDDAGDDDMIFGTAGVRGFYHCTTTVYPNAMSPTELKNRTFVIKSGAAELRVEIDATGKSGTMTDSRIGGAPLAITDAYIVWSRGRYNRIIGPYHTIMVVRVVNSRDYEVHADWNEKIGGMALGTHVTLEFSPTGLIGNLEGDISLGSPSP